MTSKFNIYLKTLPVLFLIYFFVFHQSPQVLAASCPSGGSIQVFNGFLTDPRTDANSVYGVFGSLCITDPQATIPEFSIKNFLNMKSLYYDQAASTIPKAPTIDTAVLGRDADQGDIKSHITTTDNSQLFYIKGDLTLSDNIFFPPINPERAVVIFVTGNLNFSDDFPGASGNTGGVVFIVSGNINIRSDVNIIKAMMITWGTFCSASNSSWTCPTDTVTGLSQLQITGSVVSLNSNPPPNDFPPKFMRGITSSTTPSETITYDPKYMIIFKDIFSREQAIWSEVQS